MWGAFRGIPSEASDAKGFYYQQVARAHRVWGEDFVLFSVASTALSAWGANP